MRGSTSTITRVQPQHLSRNAVISIRQSTGHPVLTNIESHPLHHAMREHAQRLGWPNERVEVAEADLGRSAPSTAGRDGYKALLAEVALGQGGIVLSYESTRLSRHCTDRYPVLELCAYNQCRLADRDGVEILRPLTAASCSGCRGAGVKWSCIPGAGGCLPACSRRRGGAT